MGDKPLSPAERQARRKARLVTQLNDTRQSTTTALLEIYHMVQSLAVAPHDRETHANACGLILQLQSNFDSVLADVGRMNGVTQSGASVQRLALGSVVALPRNSIGIIWHASDTDVWLVPIGGTNGRSRHRAEVTISEAEATACGISHRYPIARCHMAFKVAVTRMGKSSHCGSAPAALIERIRGAVRDEARTRSKEDRLQFARTIDEHCLQLLME